MTERTDPGQTQRKKGLCPPPATTLSCPFYQRILQFRPLSFLRQRGTDLRRFALEFSGAAEGLGYNDEALKDLFNSVLDEPLYWWRMRELDHLMFGEFVDFLARSPVKEAAVAADVAAMPPEVLAEEAPAPPVVAVETAASPVVAVEAAAPLEAADNAAAPHSQKRKRRRRKKTSSSLQDSEVVPELTADRGAILALPKLLALPAPPKLLALPAPSRLLALPTPPRLLALPATPRLLALPAPSRLLALPAPPKLLTLPAPPKLPALPSGLNVSSALYPCPAGSILDAGFALTACLAGCILAFSQDSRTAGASLVCPSSPTLAFCQDSRAAGTPMVCPSHPSLVISQGSWAFRSSLA
ncbi:SH3 domain-containing -like protein [Labeo rohita]|uniref:SH3 domain-containing-like protein n=1 Tax=Labeo rohita TaxID=84645 RepID=A0A498LZH4_LABRO|nr:SH3 domain-containing -like protein [Labeo rohita]RXN38468.1 SH3 domain-containing -like protein [Labeo rohita]